MLFVKMWSKTGPVCPQRYFTRSCVSSRTAAHLLSLSSHCSALHTPGMATLFNCSTLCKLETSSLVCVSAFPLQRTVQNGLSGRFTSKKFCRNVTFCPLRKGFQNKVPKRAFYTVIRSSGSSNSDGRLDETSDQNKTPFGYSRKDVLLIGLGVTLLGIGLKSGLEFLGFDSLQAGNAVQLIVVLGLTVGWISTYIFRVSNKEMTYAQQLRDYEKQVMEKRIESLSEAELEALLEQVEEEKRRLANGEQIN